MLTRIRRFLRYIVGTRFIDIEDGSPERLELRYGRTRTVFDKRSARVHQDGKLAGVFAAVDRIELHQPMNQDGPANWFITVQLQGRRQIELGKVTDKTDASLIGARIATITSRPVVVRP